MAALETRMSSLPNALFTSSNILGICSSFPMFARTAIAFTPFFWMSSTAALADSRLRKKLIATSAPMSASARAVARPIPRVPPVTSAVFPFSSPMGTSAFLLERAGILVTSAGIVKALAVSPDFTSDEPKPALAAPSLHERRQPHGGFAVGSHEPGIDGDGEALLGAAEREPRVAAGCRRDGPVHLEKNVDQGQVVEAILGQTPDHIPERDDARLGVANLDRVGGDPGGAAARARACHLSYCGAAMGARGASAERQVHAGVGSFFLRGAGGGLGGRDLLARARGAWMQSRPGQECQEGHGYLKTGTHHR